VLVALRLKGGVDRYDLSRLQEISRMVARSSGVAPERTRPIVGENAFAHESGIHIAAILEDPATYEYVPPDMVGSERRFVLGKHTGKRALEHVAHAYGFDLSDREARWVLEQVKQKSEGKCSVTREVLCNILRRAKEGDLHEHALRADPRRAGGGLRGP
jgi:methanogen homocitrate synthase